MDGSVMGDLVLKGATSGQITVTPTGVAGTNTLTLPAKTGNIITSADSGTVTQAMLASNVAGNGPAFRAFRSTTTQTISNNVDTKVQLNGETFDTANCFDSTTNYRFTPNVAGYYYLSASVTMGTATNGGTLEILARIRRNGTTDLCWSSNQAASTLHFNNVVCSTISLMNGTTDYVELYIYQNTSANLDVQSGDIGTNFFGFLARAS